MKPGKLITLIILLAVISLAGCNEVELQSQWTEPITLDGSNADWPENPQYFDEDSRVRVSLMNDDDNLYIRLLSRNQTTKMMFLRAGFTVWLDDAGNTRKKFGVQFPLARQNQMQGNITDHKPRNDMGEMLEDSLYSLAILSGPGETRQTMPTTKAAEMGIYARLEIQQGYLVYELKVPFTASEDNKTISVGFETGKIDRPAGKGSSGGGRGGRGGGGKGGKKMGGKGGAHGGGSTQPIEIWAKVHLAENASPKDQGSIEKNGMQLFGNKTQTQ
jgi:hypothetical protein